MAVDTLLSRLEGVKANGRDKWVARCPAHQDRAPSLSIRAGDDGRVLIHCFAGCGAADVLDSVGLDYGALFEKSLGEFKPMHSPFSASDALRALRREVGLVCTAAADISEGVPMSNEDKARLALAAERIAEAATYVGSI